MVSKNTYKAAISADIVASTSLTEKQRVLLNDKMLELLNYLKTIIGKEKFFGRLVKGDNLECVLDEPRSALKVALLIRTFVKAIEIKSTDDNYNNIGVRVAIGIGTITTLNKKRGFINGSAIILSGRAIQTLSDQSKTGLIFQSINDDWNSDMIPIFALIDSILIKNTKKQCGILWYCLQGKTQKEISEITKISQPTINKHIQAACWHAIKCAVDYFEEVIK